MVERGMAEDGVASCRCGALRVQCWVEAISSAVCAVCSDFELSHCVGIDERTCDLIDSCRRLNARERLNKDGIERVAAE